MRTIKRMMVYHRNFCDTMREKLEQYLKNEYHAARVCIAAGEAHIEWFAGAYGDIKEVNVFKALFRAIMTDKMGPMPENWMEIAEHWILEGISIEQVEELLGMDMIDVPNEFFEYAYEVERDYYDYCKNHESLYE